MEKVYSYNPVPDTLVTLGKDKHIKGVQANHWSEYMYNTDIMEYRMYPRMLAVSEIAWTPLDKKDYKDFERRINNAYVRWMVMMSITIFRNLNNRTDLVTLWLLLIPLL